MFDLLQLRLGGFNERGLVRYNLLDIVDELADFLRSHTSRGFACAGELGV